MVVEVTEAAAKMVVEETMATMMEIKAVEVVEAGAAVAVGVVVANKIQLSYGII